MTAANKMSVRSVLMGAGSFREGFALIASTIPIVGTKLSPFTIASPTIGETF